MRSVDVFDGRRFRNVAPAVFSDNAGWSMNHVLLQSRAGEWWAATHQGLCRFRAASAADLDGRAPTACYADDATIFTLFEDSSGGIWASGQSSRGDRLMRWNPDTQTLFEFPYPRSAGEAHGDRPDDLVSAFAEDGQGHVWMGLYKGGLYRYDGRAFQFLQPRDGLPDGPVLTLFAATSGLWIGTDGGGLGRIADTREQRPHVEILNTAHGMSSDIIECLVDDRSGRVYAGTGKGVDRLDPQTGQVRHFPNADGLARGAFHGAVRDRSGSLWFATTLGLLRLVPSEDRKPLSPHILITDLQVGGEAYAVSQVGETRVALPALKPSQNQLQVEFVGIDPEPGAGIRYAYKLEGADVNWSAPRSQPSVSYAALGAGTYRLLVKAVTLDGVESTAPAEIDFVVLAPVWRRWWFVSLAVALTAALALAAHRYRLHQILNLERMRTSIATDLHDDIGASLSQIAILSEVARVDGGAGRAETLARVATLARELVDSMGEIVWSIRSEPDGWESLVRHMREFAIDVLASQGIDFQLTATSLAKPSLNLRARRQLFLMFKECIHNVARHSRCRAVVAELRVGSRAVELTVRDDGVGSDTVDRTPGRTGGTGIAGMRRRAEGLGGRLEITSAPGSGWRVEIWLPC
jgi:signal transduction histidine kinase/streptogramin lyase